MGERNTALFLLTEVLSLIVFVGLILLVFNLSGPLLIAELALLFLLLLVTLISVIGIYFKARFGSVLMMVVQAIVLFDILCIFRKVGMVHTSTFLITGLASFIAFFIGVGSIRREEPDELSDDIEPVPPVAEQTEAVVEEKHEAEAKSSTAKKRKKKRGRKKKRAVKKRKRKAKRA